MTDIIQELRGTIDAAKLPWKEVPGPDYSELVDALGNKVALTVYPETILSVLHAVPALLDRLEAAEARFVDLEYRSAATESRLRDWDAWFDRATADDDCEYLNGAGWSDAAAIREMKP